MSPLSVTLTIAIYFIILFTVSYFAGRRADNAGFFTGNRRSSWYLVALAMIGASMSGVTRCRAWWPPAVSATCK